MAYEPVVLLPAPASPPALPPPLTTPEPLILPEHSVAGLGVWVRLPCSLCPLVTLWPQQVIWPVRQDSPSSLPALLGGPIAPATGPRFLPAKPRGEDPGPNQWTAADYPCQPRGCWELFLRRPEQRRQCPGEDSAGGARWAPGVWVTLKWTPAS